MKIEKIISKNTFNHLPLCVNSIRGAINLEEVFFTNRYVPVKKYKSRNCPIYPFYKPISKIL